MLAPSSEAIMPNKSIREIALGIFDFSTDSLAAKRYCWAKATERPIIKFPKQNNSKLLIKIA